MATYTKLRNGDWGLRGEGLREGQTVTVRKKSGQTKTETVGRVLWTGNGVSLATIARSGGGGSYIPAVRNARGYVTERGHYVGYCGYDCPVSGRKCCPANGPCHDCE